MQQKKWLKFLREKRSDILSQLTSDGDDFSRMLKYAAECIVFKQTVESYNSCNNCGGRVKPYCPYLPEAGKLARINCPLWYKEKREVKQ